MIQDNLQSGGNLIQDAKAAVAMVYDTGQAAQGGNQTLDQVTSYLAYAMLASESFSDHH